MPAELECDLWIRGVPARAKLVEIQPCKVIPLFSQRAWPAQYLERDAATDFVAMREAAEKDGVELLVYSAFRTMAEQGRLFREWQAGKRKLRPATPGKSTHQSGKSVDIQRSHDDPDGGGPLRGKTDLWLEANAARFNFHNDVKGEPWHWTHKR
jgi:LAS superfamily LD-carboxypeptidase LdcB